MKKSLLCVLMALILAFSMPISAFAAIVEKAAEPELTDAFTVDEDGYVDDEHMLNEAEDFRSADSDKPEGIIASDTAKRTSLGSFTIINPLYEGLINKESLSKPGSATTLASTYRASSVQDMGLYVRNQIKARVETFQIVIRVNSINENTFINLCNSSLDVAFTHTGQPTEGDYLAFVWGPLNLEGTYTSSGSGYDIYITYDFNYFTTIAQEKKLDAQINSVLTSMNLSGKTDYEKVKAIYDYICSHVTYDYDHLYNDWYTLKFTAYAAMINGTAVCQGYALLFYRMALALGVNNRFIAGYANYDPNAGHAWNLTRMDNGKYYLLDSTWDAEQKDYSWFLKGQNTFVNHTNDPPYGSSAKYSSYIIDTKDYDPNAYSFLATPKLGTVSNTDNGVNITWGKVNGAVKYRVFYKTDTEGWTKIADTTSTSYNWTGAKIGMTYTFTVRCLNSAGIAYTSSFDSKGLTITCSVPQVDTPVLSSVTNEVNGVKVTWGKVTGAAKYRVFYKANGESTWHMAADTTSTSYTWTGAKSGTDYTFTVRCVTSDGKYYASDFDRAGLSITYIASPTLTAVTNVANGVQISWGSVAGAEKYRVFYRIGSGAWTKITDTTSTSYIWTGAKSGTNYTFTVRCVSADGSSFTSSHDPVGKSVAYIAAPVLVSVSADNPGTTIKWNAVPGAAKYRVYAKSGTGNWVNIADTTSTSYTWKNAKYGTKYTYTVRCINSAGTACTSSFDSVGLSLTTVANPAVSSISVDSTGTVIKWGAVSGAENYRIFRKVANGAWSVIGNTMSTSFTDTTAVKGTNYVYTVRCTTADGNVFTSGYDATGKSFTTAATPVLSSVTSELTGVKITWEKATGAAKYRVFYKTENGSWTKIADTTSTSYTWTGAKSGIDYTFTVRCISADGNSYTSDFDRNGATLTYISSPVLTAVTNVANGVQVSWGSVAGAEKYRVFYRIGSGAWTKIADTTSTSYIWTGAKSGTNYTFTVRCVSADGSSFTSSHDPVGKSVTYIAAPVLVSVSADNPGTTIKWNAVPGAAKYRVYAKSGSGNWVNIADTTSTSYTWKNAKYGTKYTYTVRCINSAGTACTSSFDSVGLSLTTVANPTISSISADNTGVVIKWGAVSGAENYRIFRKVANGAWSVVGNTTSTSFTDTTAVKGTNYIYTVRCTTADGNVFTSGYDAVGKSITK